MLAFFNWIDLHVPRDLDVHVVLDNLSAHKAPEVTRWLAHPRRARWHLHFTPTSSSWLNLVEGWFKQLTDRRLRHGTFTSVAELIDAIELWAEHWNDNPKPFVWHKPAEEDHRQSPPRTSRPPPKPNPRRTTSYAELPNLAPRRLVLTAGGRGVRGSGITGGERGIGKAAPRRTPGCQLAASVQTT